MFDVSPTTITWRDKQLRPISSFLVRRRDIEQTELILISVFEFDISTLLKKWSLSTIKIYLDNCGPRQRCQQGTRARDYHIIKVTTEYHKFSQTYVQNKFLIIFQKNKNQFT